MFISKKYYCCNRAQKAAQINIPLDQNVFNFLSRCTILLGFQNEILRNIKSTVNIPTTKFLCMAHSLTLLRAAAEPEYKNKNIDVQTKYHWSHLGDTFLLEVTVTLW